MSTEAIALENITKRFGSVTAVDDISLRVREGEFFSLLGPSGCGKTTLLRLIAGLEEPDSGNLLISGASVLGVPPQGRAVNTVFQNYALFPHLNVFDNVAFGLRMKGTARRELQQRVDSALDLVRVSELRERFPNQISGGQKQRVALARALVNEPRVLLLDEPLAAIDAKLRAQLQVDLKAIQRKLGTTFIYVTHDQDEALALSDRLAILSHGRIAQLGTPEEVYERPRSRFVASFLGACNVLSGIVASINGSAGKIKTAAGLLTVHSSRPVGSEVFLGIRREKIQLANDNGCENLLEGRIIEVTYTGAQSEFSVDVNGLVLRGLHANSRASSIGLSEGQWVKLQLPAEAIVILDSE